jgi:hypothetical protein
MEWLQPQKSHENAWLTSRPVQRQRYVKDIGDAWGAASLELPTEWNEVA